MWFGGFYVWIVWWCKNCWICYYDYCVDGDKIFGWLRCGGD